MGWWWWGLPLLATVLLVVALVLLVKPLRTLGRAAEGKYARQLFLQQREHLEADFLRAAVAAGKPRGLRWKACEWERPVEMARDRHTGQLAALVGVTIQFEAVPGSDMEDLPAVGNLRNATAVFFFERGRWQTAGRALFNMNPDEAIAHFRHQYERIEAT